MTTTPAVTPTRTSSNAAMAIMLISPSASDSHVRITAAGKPSMIEKKIISDMPFPMPRSVICSPSHITNTAPVVRATMVVNMKPNPGLATAPWMPCKNTEYPYAWAAERMTVV